MENEDKKTEAIYREVTVVLNKLTPQTFNTLVNRVRQLNIDNKERLQGVVDIVYEKAIDEPDFSLPCAMMCRVLQNVQVPADAQTGDEKKTVAFKHLLVTRCQQEFEMHLETKKEPEFLLEEYNRKSQLRSLGCIRFIGNLFKHKMLTASIMKRCIQSLLMKGDDDSLKCLSVLLMMVGKDLDLMKIDFLTSKVTQPPPPSASSPPSSKRKRVKKNNNNESLKLAGKQHQKPDEYENWALSCAADLKKMEPMQQIFAKNAISAIIMKGRLGLLHANSVKTNELTDITSPTNFSSTSNSSISPSPPQSDFSICSIF